MKPWLLVTAASLLTPLFLVLPAGVASQAGESQERVASSARDRTTHESSKADAVQYWRASCTFEVPQNGVKRCDTTWTQYGDLGDADTIYHVGYHELFTLDSPFVYPDAGVSLVWFDSHLRPIKQVYCRPVAYLEPPIPGWSSPLLYPDHFYVSSDCQIEDYSSTYYTGVQYLVVIASNWYCAQPSCTFHGMLGYERD